MTKPWPPPPIKPFDRLKVTDGLLINAQRWQLAHQYHRQYHNVCYQSIHQPGIVCGLGVHITTHPPEVGATFRDERWVEIQPGIAIDLYGNFIVVPEAMTYRISSEVKTEESLIMVYLVVRFRDPEELRTRKTDEKVTETYRLDEKTSPPSEGDVELCRILLKSGKVKLENPRDVFFPSYNQLDLRYRLQAQARPQTIVQIATYKEPAFSSSQMEGLMGIFSKPPAENPIVANLSYLLQSVAGLYPPLQGSDEIGELTLQPEEVEKLLDYDLFFLTAPQSQSLGESELEVLRQYLHSGGVVLVEVSTQGTTIEELSQVKQELEKAIADLGTDSDINRYRRDLEDELRAIDSKLEEQVNQLCFSLKDFSDRLGISLESLQKLSRNHPLRLKPFLFAALPHIDNYAIQLFTADGLIVVIGNLSAAWGLDDILSLSRETIRTAQEMGINILHFAWRRRQLTQGQRSVETISPLPKKPKPSERTRRDDLYDRLI
ncbi:MAG TPA: hypothetical protein DDZ80_12455 [Cyanobacteria bacterium UBA8803]|nr:hypothetical protein [Cyanobacteria bacterium UBA9273]HBL59289.1 hypothetical protein [Cyanobacteria bacterium UBA8803]